MSSDVAVFWHIPFVDDLISPRSILTPGNTQSVINRTMIMKLSHGSFSTLQLGPLYYRTLYSFLLGVLGAAL